MDIKLQAMPRSRISEFTLSLHRNDGSDLCGVVRHNISENRWLFNSLFELIRILNNAMEYLSFPQAGMVIRTWHGTQRPPVSPEQLKYNHAGIQMLSMEKEARATVVICFQYRQNASWQGTIRWLDAGRTQHFRSALEMILLLGDIID